MRSRMPFTLAGMVLLVASRVAPADSLAPFVITPEAGPWLICVASYSGPEAAQKAHDLVQDIRNRYRLPAYVFNRGEKERQAEQERLRQLKSQMPGGRFRTVRIEDQYAVLVGGYKDIDSARKALDDIKKLKPSDKRLMNVLFGGVTTASANSSQKEEAAVSYVSPFMDAFVVPNPTTVQERKVERKLDYRLLKELNAEEELSLLKCRQPYTLAVAAFQGLSTITPHDTSSSFLDKLFSRAGESLSASALNAHNFAEALRKAGYEAYVLHLKQGSLVTIGSFGSREDPRIQQLQQSLVNNLQLTGRVEMLAQPFVMEVPKP